MWKDIKNWEGLYKVSDNGVVKNAKTNRIVPLQENTAGYFRVALYDHERKEKRLIHRIVADTFIPNPKNLPEVNHIDGDKSNNNVSNLEWCTRTHNQRESLKKFYTHRYKPFLVTWLDDRVEKFDFCPDLSGILNITPGAVTNWLKQICHGFEKYGIKSIEYV